MNNEFPKETDPLQVLRALRTPISQIDNFVYMGNKQGAVELSQLKSLKVKNIIQIQNAPTVPLLQGEFNYHLITLPDSVDQNISSCLPEALEFISEAIKKGEKTFVHCDAGASRSGSVVIAYIMGFYSLSYEDALVFARKGRACVCPNSSFARQLKALDYSVLNKFN